jgi:hypothetical protein
MAKQYRWKNEPVHVLQKTSVAYNNIRIRLWFCKLPDGTAKWIPYRDLTRVVVSPVEIALAQLQAQNKKDEMLR